MTADDLIKFVVKWEPFGGGDEYILPEFGIVPAVFYDAFTPYSAMASCGSIHACGADWRHCATTRFDSISDRNLAGARATSVPPPAGSPTDQESEQ